MSALTPLVGPVISPPRVQKALIAHIKTWIDDYLRFIEDADSDIEQPPIERPAHYSIVPQTPPSWAPLPYVVVTCAGGTGKSIDQDGSVSITYPVTIAAFCLDTGAYQDHGMDDVAVQAQAYAVALSLLLDQQPVIAENVRALSSSGFQFNTGMDQARSRTFQMAEAAYDIRVTNAWNVDHGPSAPSQSDPDPAVDSFTVNITKEATVA